MGADSDIFGVDSRQSRWCIFHVLMLALIFESDIPTITVAIRQHDESLR